MAIGIVPMEWVTVDDPTWRPMPLRLRRASGRRIARIKSRGRRHARQRQDSHRRIYDAVKPRAMAARFG